jgi:hypothetical protein
VRIDNSAFTLYMKCPRMYFERYEADATSLQYERLREPNVPDEVLGVPSKSTPAVAHDGLLKIHPSSAGRGIELASRSRDGLDFGTRFHSLADNARRNVLGLQLAPESRLDGRIEDEVQATFAQYQQHWLGNEYTYIESERTHVLPLPQTEHQLVVKIDGVVRHADGTIGPLDTKTESKPGYNFREDWAGRTQASLYLWALQTLYPTERVSRLVVDVVTRGGPKRAPSFSRIDDISRPQAALEDAIRNVIWVCEDIEISRRTGWWRSNMNLCKEGWKRCDYYSLHVYGRTEENLRLYRPAEQYLDV